MLINEVSVGMGEEEQKRDNCYFGTEICQM